MKEMVTRKTWKEFRESGLLWWINRQLHLFGWAIVVDVEKDGTISNAYPARVRFRGFDEKSEAVGFIKLTKYLKGAADELEREAED